MGTYRSGDFPNHLGHVFKQRVVASIPHCVCLSVGLSVGRSKKSKNAIMSISWLRISYLSTVIPHTIINELLAGTVPLENYLPQLVQQKMRKTYMVVLLLLSLNAYPCFISGELT